MTTTLDYVNGLSDLMHASYTSAIPLLELDEGPRLYVITSGEADEAPDDSFQYLAVQLGESEGELPTGEFYDTLEEALEASGELADFLFHVAPGEITWDESGEAEPCLLTSKALAGREGDALVWAIYGGEEPAGSSNHEVLDGEAAKALGQEIARAAGRPEVQGGTVPPDHAQPGEESPRDPHRGELSGS